MQKLKLGTPVTITQRFQKNKKITDEPNGIPENAIEVNKDCWEFSRYSPIPCAINGIITGYKQLCTKIDYTIIPNDKVSWDDICTKYQKEPVYVVQTSLTKKYFVKRKWIFGIKEA